MRRRARASVQGFLGLGLAAAGWIATSRAGEVVLSDPVHSVPVPLHANGYPSRDANLEALPGFQDPPAGYGEVPFWWWTGDPLDEERLIWQIDQLHLKGISGVQVNYAHEDSPGWPTYAAEPPIFSDPWWRIWGRIADESRKRGMGIGLSTYTQDWTGADNLFRRLFYSNPELNAFKLAPLPRQRLKNGASTTLAAPADLIAARAYRVVAGQLQNDGTNLMAHIRNGQLTWSAPDGEWEPWLIRAERQANTLNPLLIGIGDVVIRDFYQRFQDATPNHSHEGLNYFFNDELQVGAGTHVWNADFAAEFQIRKGYDLFEFIPALWSDLGAVTPKIRMDYADVRMALMEERYFQPIYRWHASRGLIFACDSGGRGLRPEEFGDYFRATRWYTAPGHDTPGGNADLIKGKVSSSIASLYRRPRVWLEGYHSLGWGATPERLMLATRENYLYGCTLLNLHGLYYTTHGSFWEWAPPCYHFRMPYWEHMGTFLKYFERLSYLMSQGTFVCDVAVLYPVAPFEAGLDGQHATKTAFDTARALMAAGVNFEFIDADSLARARVDDGRLEVTDSSYRALIFPSMQAVRWSSLEKASRFAKAGGLVWNVGTLPFASDRAGRDDPDLNALVAATFPIQSRLANPADAPERILVRYNQAGRGYFVLKRDETESQPAKRTPLAMTWFDDPSVIRFDTHAGTNPGEWFRFSAPPNLRAITLTAKGTVKAWANGQPMRANADGRFEVVAPNPRTTIVALHVTPQTGTCGGAVFHDPVRLECGSGVTALGDWSKTGALECYSGGAWYRRTVTLTREQAKGRIMIDLGKVVATAEVRVNDQLAGIRVAPPWRVDISNHVKLGENRIEVLVFNTLANHSVTIPTRYRGELTSGLLGPVALEVSAATNNRKEEVK